MKNINVHKYITLKSKDIEKLCKRAESDLSEYNNVVDGIIENVRKNKDKALEEYSLSLDNVELGLKTFKVSDNEFSKAFNILDPDFKETLAFCSENVKKFHEKQMPKKEWMIEMHSGVYAGEKIEPIETVALYVPRGKG